MIEKDSPENSKVSTYCSFCGTAILASIDDDKPLCVDCQGDGGL